jgi:methanogenic corrinoid protein MtbC1
MNDNALDNLILAITSGDEKSAVRETRYLLKSGIDKKRIIIDAVEVAMEQLDAKCTVEQFNLLEIMLSGRAVTSVIKELYPDGEASDNYKGTVILGSLEGDVHDIGKNILKMVLNAKGYRVVDGGKDCPTEKFVEMALTEQPLAIGISGLITTVIPQMKKLREQMKNAGLMDTKLIAGGAALKQSTAENLNVDFLAQNTFDGLNYLNSLIV